MDVGGGGGQKQKRSSSFKWWVHRYASEFRRNNGPGICGINRSASLVAEDSGNPSR